MRDFFASCPKGLEYLLVDELVALGGADVHEALAGVHFRGELGSGYAACLWSRLASRVLMPLAEFPAEDADALYAGARAIDWSEHLGVDSTFAVDAVGGSAAITHSQYAALRVKDAIADAFRDATGSRPNVDTERPALRVNVVLPRGRAIVGIDLAGTPLHQRGYRQGKGIAPLKENLAAAMLLRAGWPAIHAAGGGIVDPLCGSGTLLIEAALMAADVAPGLRRDYFGFLGWRQHDAALWKTLHDAAQARATAGLRALQPVFFGFDQDPAVLNEARRNAQHALLSGFIHFGRQSLEHLQRPHELGATGLVITNPPYGERMGGPSRPSAASGGPSRPSVASGGPSRPSMASGPLGLLPGAAEPVAALYGLLGAKLKAQFPGWRACIITSDEALGRAVGLRADRKYVLYNGALECVLLTFDVRAADAVPAPPRPLSPGAQMLRNRIDKTHRHLRKRAEREGIGAWRVYDADLPEYASAIDIYHSAGGDYLHIQEYQAPASVDEALARTRLRETVRVAGEALGVDRERIALKTRQRGKGGAKYGRLEQRGEFLEVGEGGLVFLVNLWDYLDTGLFLDHRPLRARVRELARGKRFLNLFCYTASASVYAAAGGAAETTSVDLSQTYLDWAAQNLARNGFAGERHRLVRADALEFLGTRSAMYDLIFVDPPTFSNSKRAEDFDVQRDHARLLRACAERLFTGGVIVFSNNFRRFRLDESLHADFVIRDTSAQSIPFDFSRNQRIHKCYEIHKK
jgi:23S rRNA (guanine2445-N2)-methyltransferase / 23S rRNA (guanine2069-N7)-methyltransferase